MATQLDDRTETPEIAETPFETRVSVDGRSRVELINLLNQHIADMFDLYTQTKQAHWNVRGIHFQQLHELFDDVAAPLPEFVDELAERAGTLGGYARGTARMVATHSRIPEFPEDVTEGVEVTRAVAERWGYYSSLVREAIDIADDLDDDVTEDLFTEISRAVEKNLWFIESHLQ